MERLTKRYALDGHEVNFVDGDGCFDVWSVPKKFMGEAIDRLAAYEDTGLEPEEIRAALEGATREFAAYDDLGPIDHLRELVQAEKDGRLVVLHSPRMPLIWGDDNHDTILCPNCKRDLMGGFLMEGSCEMNMYQCPYCGQLIDETKATPREEAEAALKGSGGIDG